MARLFWHFIEFQNVFLGYGDKMLLCSFVWPLISRNNPVNAFFYNRLFVVLLNIFFTKRAVTFAYYFLHDPFLIIIAGVGDVCKLILHD